MAPIAIEFPLKTAEGELSDIPEEGSIGLIAMGHVGIMLFARIIGFNKKKLC